MRRLEISKRLPDRRWGPNPAFALRARTRRWRSWHVIRHPSYLGLLVNSLGWALVFRSGVGVLLTALLIPPLFARIRAEEALLRTQFGDEYDAYCSRTADSRALLR
jgi:Phospholipid methyltransferase